MKGKGWIPDNPHTHTHTCKRLILTTHDITPELHYTTFPLYF